jgi:hypothetical protein
MLTASAVTSGVGKNNGSSKNIKKTSTIKAKAASADALQTIDEFKKAKRNSDQKAFTNQGHNKNGDSKEDDNDHDLGDLLNGEKGKRRTDRSDSSASSDR